MLPLTEYQFKYYAIEEVTLPSFSGSLWHGVFGRALRSQVCVAENSECEHCMLKHSCDYAYLFHGPLPKESEMMRNYNTIPVPHVVRLADNGRKSVEAGAPFSINMVLVGESHLRIAAVIRAMLGVGQAGFGKARSKARLFEVVQIELGALPRLIMGQGKMYHAPQPGLISLPTMPSQFRLVFKTPYKQSSKQTDQFSTKPVGHKEGRHYFDLKKMLMAIIRRISLLKYFYTGELLDADFKQLKVMASEIQPIDLNIKWCAQKRYSARSQSLVEVGGWMGHVDFSSEGLEPFWPYLHLGQWLHVGKNSSMGFGRYELVSLA